MALHRLRSLAARRFGWLLWLALLLPLGQGAVAWHALSHVGQATAAAPAGGGDGADAAHAAHCDLCLAAAALGAAAAPQGPAGLPVPDQRQAAVAAATAVPPALARVWAYRSRAPPVLSR